jgi:hypothetical protein
MQPMKIQEQVPLSHRLIEWGYATLFSVVAVMSLYYIHEHYANKREIAAYQKGFATAKQLLEQPMTEEQQSAIAVQWWSNADDMKGARQRLCANVAANALKGSK